MRVKTWKKGSLTGVFGGVKVAFALNWEGDYGLNCSCLTCAIAHFWLCSFMVWQREKNRDWEREWFFGFEECMKREGGKEISIFDGFTFRKISFEGNEQWNFDLFPTQNVETSKWAGWEEASWVRGRGKGGKHSNLDACLDTQTNLFDLNHRLTIRNVVIALDT